MAENSHISWTDHTFNPWIGCTKVSPACDGCYAAELMGTEGSRFKRVTWGEPGKGEGTRDRTKDWSKPRKWNRQAADAPGQTFVFCASLADVFDNAVPPEWRRDLFNLIRETQNLTWLLLTKRPQLIVKLYQAGQWTAVPAEQDTIPIPSLTFPRNVILGTTIEDKKRLANAFALNSAAKELGLRQFWSCEPLLEDLGDVSGFLPDWVITGGETDQGAHKARPADPAWYRSLRDQCAAAGVPFHFKQWGEWVGAEVYSEQRDGGTFGGLTRVEGGGHAPGAPTEWWDGDTWAGRVSVRVGKDSDPCTLDGVTHRARPAVAR